MITNLKILFIKQQTCAGNWEATGVKANCLWDNAGGHAFAIINAPAADGFLLSGCFGEVVNSGANGLNANSVADGKWAKNTFKGCTTAVVNTNANNMVNTADTYGNLLI